MVGKLLTILLDIAILLDLLVPRKALLLGSVCRIDHDIVHIIDLHAWHWAELALNAVLVEMEVGSLVLVWVQVLSTNFLDLLLDDWNVLVLVSVSEVIVACAWLAGDEDEETEDHGC